MGSYNRIEILGRLGQDPELRYTQSGKAVCRLSIATNEGKRGTDSERTLWHRVVAWEGLAEVCSRYLGKGSTVLVVGRIDYRNYEDKEGSKRLSVEIIASDVIFVDTKTDADRRSREEDLRDEPEPDGGGSGSDAGGVYGGADAFDEEIPF